MKRYLALALSACIALGLALSEGFSDQVVFLKDGRRIIGQVTKTDDGYEVKTNSGGTCEVTSQSVLKIEDAKTLRQQLQDRLDRIEPTDAEGLYQIARLATDNMLLDEAKQILEQALKVRPDFENAKQLLKKVNAAIDDLKAASKPSEAAAGKPATEQAKLNCDLIDQEDVYRIRRALLGPKDNVQIEFRNDVIEKFIIDQQGSADFAEHNADRKFRSLPRLQQAQYMLANQDRDSKLRDDILIKSEPRLMSDFKTRVWPVVLNSCASAKCHGGVNAPAGFRLYVDPSPKQNEQMLYTDFAIIYGYGEQIRGQVAGKMVDPRVPEDSLLLQLGLPEKLSKVNHLAEITPPFKNTNEGPYRVIREWIRNLPVLPGGLVLDYYKQFAPASPTSAPNSSPAKAPVKPPGATPLPAFPTVH